MNFTIWLSKRIGRAIIYGPNKVYKQYLELMREEWILAALITTFFWIGISALIGIITNNSLYVIYWSLFAASFVIISIINIQYQIYREEVARTMDQLKRKSYEF